MNCPYCGKEMEKGEVQIGDSISALVRGGHAVWVPQKECKKILPKNTVNLKPTAEGYYCDQCVKVVAIFDDRGADFFQ